MKPAITGAGDPSWYSTCVDEIRDSADRAGEDAALLAAHVQRVRDTGALGRSDAINRLFDFLAQESTAGRSPKELEVGREVFGKSSDFDMGQDASVRVYVHRLRRKLDEVYAGQEGERLVIPRGEYRLAVTRAAVDPVEPDLAPTPEPVEPLPVPPRRRPVGWIVAAVLLVLALNLAGWWWVARRPAGHAAAAADTTFWRALTGSGRPTWIVSGDYYIFGEAPGGTQVTRLVREFAINSREDLDQYLMTHPEEEGRKVDVDLHYLPTSTAAALRYILPVADVAARDGAGAAPRTMRTSQLTPEALKGINLVYVGFFSGLGLLRDPLFAASGFRVGDSYDELIDEVSGKHYVSDWEQVTSRGTPRRDYGYLASFPGPSGNRVLVVAGTRDASVMQAAEHAADKTQLDEIARRTGNAANFEALYEVRTLGNLNVGSSLVVARPIKGGAWGIADKQQRFPDELPAADRMTAHPEH